MIDTILFIIIFIIITFSFTVRGYAVNRRDTYLLRAGLVCTLLADFCMLILYNNIIGLILFICVQTIYFFRYLSARIYAAIILPLLLCVFIVLSFTPLPLETRLSAVYACVMISSVLSAFTRRKLYPFPNRVLIPLGMVLFMLCDINVAMINILPASMAKSAAQVLIWVFYLPSQALLSVSGARISVGLSYKRMFFKKRRE